MKTKKRTRASLGFDSSERTSTVARKEEVGVATVSLCNLKWAGPAIRSGGDQETGDGSNEERGEEVELHDDLLETACKHGIGERE
jgi:hypothetical protein